MTIQHMSEVKAENARLREEGRKLVEANTKHFNTATENYKEAVRLREELARVKESSANRLIGLCKCGEERDRLREELEVSRKWKDTYELGLEAAKIELACTKDILEQTRVELSEEKRLLAEESQQYEDLREVYDKACDELAAWKQTAEAHKENFDILAGDLRMKLAAAQAAVKKYSDLLRICRLSNLSQELDAAIDAAMKEVGHE